MSAATGLTVLSTTGRPVVLTEREVQVADLVAEGMSNSEIGRRLYLARSTVNTHLRRVYRRLGVRSRAQMVARLGRALGPDAGPDAGPAGCRGVNGQARGVVPPLLTVQERQVADLVAEGLSNSEIGARLGISSIDTMKSLVSRVLCKCGARNRAELAARVAGRQARQHTEAVAALVGALRATPLDAEQRGLVDKLAELVGSRS